MSSLMMSTARAHFVYGVPLAPANYTGSTPLAWRTMLDEDDLDEHPVSPQRRAGLFCSSDANDDQHFFGVVLHTANLHTSCHHVELSDLQALAQAAQADYDRALAALEPLARRVVDSMGTAPRVFMVLDLDDER